MRLDDADMFTREIAINQLANQLAVQRDLKSTLEPLTTWLIVIGSHGVQPQPHPNTTAPARDLLAPKLRRRSASTLAFDEVTDYALFPDACGMQ